MHILKNYFKENKTKKLHDILYVIFALIIVFSNFTIIKTYAQLVWGTPAEGTALSFYTSEEISIVEEGCPPGTYASGQTITGAVAISASTSGYSFQRAICLEASSGTTGLINYLNNNNTNAMNAVASISGTILEQRPLSGLNYIDQKVTAFTNAGKVNAQDVSGRTPEPYFPGLGYQLLSPIQGFWGWSVNVVYGFMILIIIGIAFAIMFRQNLGGSQVVTIQNAIPNIALAMILIPLSYGISGLFIDLISVGTNTVHAFLLGPGAPGEQIYNARNNKLGAGDCANTTTNDDPCDRGLYVDDYRMNWLNIRNQVDIQGSVSNLSEDINIGGTTVNNFVLFVIIKDFLNLVSGQGKQPAYWFGEIVNALLSLLMIWIGIKIAWRLIKKYLILVVTPIFSPFIFASAAVPGNGTKSIMQYIKLMASGSLFFIVTYACFLFTLVFTSDTFQNTIPAAKSASFVPPLIGVAQLSDVVGGAGTTSLTRFVFTLIGMGIYFSIPAILDGIDKSLGTNSPLPAFLTTPFNSFRESINVTTRATQTAFRTGVNVNQFRRTAVPQTEKFLRNRFDQLKGLQPGDEGTWQVTKSRDLAKQKSKAERTVAEAKAKAQQTNSPGDYLALRQAQRELDNVNREIDRYDIPIAPGKDEKPSELKVSYTLNGQPGPISFSRDQMDDFRKRSNRGERAFVVTGIDIKFETTNYILPSTIRPEVYAVEKSTEFGDKDVIKKINGQQIKLLDDVIGDPSNKAVPPDPNAPAPLGTVKINATDSFPLDEFRPISFGGISDVLELRVDPSLGRLPTQDNKNWKFGANLVIRDIDRLFGYRGMPPILTSNTPILSEKVIFKIGQYESNSLRIVVNATRPT